MKKSNLMKVFLVLCVSLVLILGASNGVQVKHHYIAGDDLPINIGKSSPRG